MHLDSNERQAEQWCSDCVFGGVRNSCSPTPGERGILTSWTTKDPAKHLAKLGRDRSVTLVLGWDLRTRSPGNMQLCPRLTVPWGDNTRPGSGRRGASAPAIGRIDTKTAGRTSYLGAPHLIDSSLTAGKALGIGILHATVSRRTRAACHANTSSWLPSPLAFAGSLDSLGAYHCHSPYFARPRLPGGWEAGHVAWFYWHGGTPSVLRLDIGPHRPPSRSDGLVLGA